MARKHVTDLSSWPSLTLEGNLISPAMVARIATPKDDETTRQSYRIRKGLSIRDEISTSFRVGQSHFDAFRKLENPSPEATRRFMRDFLAETLGFVDIAPHEGAVSLLAGGRVPVVVVPPDEEKLDRKSPTLSTDRSRSAAFALQDYVNERDDALWGLATNGAVLRLMRDNASLTRPAYIEADLAQIFTNEDAASFSIFWLLFHRTRFGLADTPATDCDLERWRDAGAKEGEASRDRLAGQVKLALKLLGSGFLEANPELSKRLQSGEIPLTGWFNELLRLIYRLIFLMVAEDRNLLHPSKAPAAARKLYADGYSLSALRALCTRASTWDRHHDRFEGIKIVFRALADGEESLALPALGGLFATGELPNLETARLRNRAFMEALYRLSWLADKSGMVPVNWRSMETEELGSVYESLLELQPQLGSDGRSLVFASDAAEQKGNQRKTTGSYYTPDSLVQALLDKALDPVLDQTEAKSDDPAKALLKLSVIDPACGSGHFLLAAARRIATRLARIRAEGTPSTEDFRHALRDVARCCIHGVDRNPMAVELTMVALWIETVDPGLPLGFFTSQIRPGDSLLGIFDLKVLEDGIPDAAYKPLTGDDKDTAKYYAQANKGAKGGQGELNLGGSGWQMPDTKPLAVDFSDFRDLPEETVSQIEAKAERFEKLREKPDFTRVQTAADLYVAAFLLPKTGGAPTDTSKRTVPTTEDLWQVLNQGKIRDSMTTAPQAARRARAFHWPLEFPDVMQRGGFDVVLGNPPWERIKIQEHEYFAARNPEIGGAKSAKTRAAMISKLRSAPAGSPERTLYFDFESARREAEAVSSFVLLTGGDGARFPLTGRGDVNTYALFAELFMCLGKLRTGVIVPTGIATDALTAPFFSYLVEMKRLARLVDFENSAPIFPGVHRSFKFSLLTLGRNESEAHFAFFLTDPAQLADRERNFTLSPETICSLNPNTRTASVFRSRADAELTSKIYAKAPILVNSNTVPEENPWKIGHASTFFDMTRDVHHFHSPQDLEAKDLIQLGGNWIAPETSTTMFVPLFEAKMLHLFDHRWSSNSEDDSIEKDETANKSNPHYEPVPRFWVSSEEVAARLQKQGWRRSWLIGIRKIARTTDERTIIASVFPIGAVGNSEHIIFPGSQFSISKICYFVGAVSSLAFDYVARQKIGGANLNYFYLEQLPVPSPVEVSPPVEDFIVPRMLELTYTSHSLTPFARDLGYDGPPFGWDEDRRALLRAELDAFYARAYGLDRDELRYILDPADVRGPDYPSETFRVLKEKEIRLHGEYRTRRLVLEAWDRMMADGTFAVLDLTSGSKQQDQPVQISLPAAKELKDRSWAWPPQVGRKDRLRYAAQYALWISDPQQDASRLRILIASLAEPAMLSGWLTKDERTLWERLIGPEARPLAGGVVRLHPETNTAWKAAFGQLITSGQLREEQDGAWTRGSHFDVSGLSTNSPDAQRAAFALNVIRRMNIEQLRPSIILEDNIIWEKLAYGT